MSYLVCVDFIKSVAVAASVKKDGDAVNRMPVDAILATVPVREKSHDASTIEEVFKAGGKLNFDDETSL